VSAARKGLYRSLMRAALNHKLWLCKRDGSEFVHTPARIVLDTSDLFSVTVRLENAEEDDLYTAKLSPWESMRLNWRLAAIQVAANNRLAASMAAVQERDAALLHKALSA